MADDGGRPLRADAARNREKVLRAAREAFAESGYGVPLDEIAARAGVGPGTVYRHFPAKEALFEAVVTARITDLVNEARVRADAADPGEAFFGFLTRMPGKPPPSATCPMPSRSPARCARSCSPRSICCWAALSALAPSAPGSGRPTS